MTDAEKIQVLIRYRLEQATEAMAAAELSLANGLYRSAVNRAYYAMFYSVLALLASRQAETSRHSGHAGHVATVGRSQAFFRSGSRLRHA